MTETASHPDTRPQTPCGQSCESCGKAEGCSAAISLIAGMGPLTDAGHVRQAGKSAWK